MGWQKSTQQGAKGPDAQGCARLTLPPSSRKKSQMMDLSLKAAGCLTLTPRWKKKSRNRTHGICPFLVTRLLRLRTLAFTPMCQLYGQGESPWLGGSRAGLRRPDKLSLGTEFIII